MDIDPLDVPLPEDDVPLPLQQPRDVKLPPFWTTRPRGWFIYVEDQLWVIHADSSSTIAAVESVPQPAAVAATLPFRERLRRTRRRLT